MPTLSHPKIADENTIKLHKQLDEFKTRFDGKFEPDARIKNLLKKYAK